MTARTVTGNTILLTGSAQASQTVTFVKRYATISGVVITQSGSTTATTDASGDFSKSLDCPASGSTSWTLVCPDGSEFDFTLPYGDGDPVAVTTLISAATVDADAVTLLLDGYEPDLGNPGTSGHVLSSTTAGVRSWVAQSGGGASDVTDLTTTTGSPAQMLNVAGAGGLQYRTVAQVLADLRDSGALATTDIGVLVSNTNEYIVIACSDETTALTAGTAKATFRMPYAMTVTGVRASVTTAPTGSTLTVDINDGGTTILSTKLTIDATEKTSTTAATPAVISDTALASDAEITIDIDSVGSTVAGAGLKVTLIGTR